jgi:hypothetical protein
VDAEVLNGTNHVVETHEISAPQNGKDHGTDESPYKAFYRLLGRQLYKRRPTHSYTPDVGEAVIANNKRGWNPEPDEAFENVVHNEMTTSRK